MVEKAEGAYIPQSVFVFISCTLSICLRSLHISVDHDHHGMSCAVHLHSDFFSSHCLALNGSSCTVNGLAFSELFKCVTSLAINASITTCFCFGVVVQS